MNRAMSFLNENNIRIESIKYILVKLKFVSVSKINSILLDPFYSIDISYKFLTNILPKLYVNIKSTHSIIL